MLILGIILANFLVGTVIGRALFIHRLGNSSRYTIKEKGWKHGEYRTDDTLFTTVDKASASTYGLWSLVIWPLALAVYWIQAPTPHERRVKRTVELETAEKELEAVAKKYNLKLEV